jgi:branched-chain amino acid transport system substrate-binding protein
MKNMKREFFGVIRTTLTITVLFAASVLFSAPVYAEPIKVGVLFSTTGGFAAFGVPAQRGALLALEQANAAGGIKGQKIEAIVYDAESNPDQASRQAKKLIVRDKVVAIVGPESWRLATLINALGVENKIPIFTDLPAPGVYPAEQVAWTFTFAGGGDTNFLAAATYFKSLGVKRLAFFGTADPWGEKLIKDIETEAPKFGMTLVGVQLAPVTSTDVTPQLAVLKEKKPDALIVLGGGPFGNISMNNASQVGLDIPTNYIGANIIPTFLQGLGSGAAKNVRFGLQKSVAYYDLDDKDPAKPIITAFANAYRAKYKEEINWASACGYDGGRMVVDALKAAGPDPQGIKKYMDGMKNWEGPGTGRRMTMLLESHYIQHDYREHIIVRWDVGEKRFRKVGYVRDYMK